MNEETLEQELNGEFVSPQKQFQGKPLAKYTEGSRLLLMQIKDENDSPVFFVWSFIYLHLLLAKNRQETIKLAWDKNLFREKVIEWVDTLNDEARSTANALCGSILDEASKAQVDIIPNALQDPLGKV